MAEAEVSNNQKLYNNLISSKRVTADQIGNYDTFNTMLKDPANATKLYQNLTKDNKFKPEEIGTQDEFLTHIDKPQATDSDRYDPVRDAAKQPFGSELPAPGQPSYTPEQQAKDGEEMTQQSGEIPKNNAWDKGIASGLAAEATDFGHQVGSFIKSTPDMAKLAGINMLQYVNSNPDVTPEDKSRAKWINDQAQGLEQNIKQDNNYTPKGSGVGNFAGKLAGTTGMLAGALVTKSPALMNLALGKMTADAAVDIGMAYDDFKKSKGEPVNQDEKAGAMALSALLMKYSGGEWTKSLLPKSVLKPVISSSINGNIESLAPAGKELIENLLKNEPSIGKKLLSNALKGAKGGAIFAGINTTGQEIINDNLIGMNFNPKKFGKKLAEQVGGGIAMGIMLSPFAMHNETAAQKAQDKAAGAVTISQEADGKPIKIIPTQDGVNKGMRPDGSLVDVTQDQIKNSFTVPLDVFNKAKEDFKAHGKVVDDIAEKARLGNISNYINKITNPDGLVYTTTDKDGTQYFGLGKDKEGKTLLVDQQGNKFKTDATPEFTAVDPKDLFSKIEQGYNPKSEKLGETKAPEAQAPPPPTPRQQAETEAIDFHKQNADKDTGNLKVVIQKTSDGENDKPWFVTKEWKNPVTGKQEMIVQDGEGNHDALTQDQLAGEPQEISQDDFTQLRLNEFDQQQQAQKAQQDNTLTFEGKKLTRIPNGDGAPRPGDKTEIFEDENKNLVEVPLDIVAAWEKGKQQTQDPNIVTRQYGKVKVDGTKTGDVISVSDPMTKDQAEQLREEVERTTGGKSTVTAELIPSDDSTVADSYKVSINPMETPEVPMQPKPEATAPIPKYPIDKQGNPDIDKMDEAQLFDYNKETFGEETAIADLKGDIKLISDKIDKANKKLEKADTKTKIKTRLEIKDLTDQKAKLEGLIPAKKENISKKNTLKVPKIKAENAVVQPIEENKPIESEQKLQENNIKPLKTEQNATKEGEQPESDITEHPGAVQGERSQEPATAKEADNSNSGKRSKRIKEKVKKSISKIQKEAYNIETSPTDIHAIVMKHFIAGGKIHPEALQELFGNSGNNNRKAAVESERKARFTWTSKEGQTISQISHSLWEDHGHDINGDQINGMTDQDFRDEVESVIKDYSSPIQMAKDLVESHGEKKYSDQQIQDMEKESIFNTPLNEEDYLFIDNSSDYPEEYIRELEKHHDLTADQTTELNRLFYETANETNEGAKGETVHGSPEHVSDESITGQKSDTEEIVKEINSKPLTRVEWLGMGQHQAKGVYVSTEGKNRYETPENPAKKVKIDISNPAIFDQNGNKFADFQRKILNDNKELFTAEDLNTSDGELTVDDLTEKGSNKLAELVTDDLYNKGFDSIYFNGEGEGEIVVFDPKAVKGEKEKPLLDVLKEEKKIGNSDIQQKEPVKESLTTEPTHIPKEELDKFDFKDEDITKAKKKCIPRPKGGVVL